MKSLIIGSTAMRHWFGDHVREAKDVDVWAKEYPTHLGLRIDRNVDIFWDDRLEPFVSQYLGDMVTPDDLYTIKVSHASWDLTNGSWPKHMADIVFLKEEGYGNLDEELWATLQEIWKDRHGRPRVNLNQESGKFFTDAVVRIYDHDSIHDTVAHYHRPLWMEVLKDGQDVAMDMAKVWKLPFDDQIKLFREEVYATALERWLIPAWEKDRVFSPTQAYYWALRKTITSLTKGKSSRFMIENFDIFRQLPRSGGVPSYVLMHQANREKLIKL
jgi:hypothetical protein